jgi:hypothetical protein
LFAKQLRGKANFSEAFNLSLVTLNPYGFKKVGYWSSLEQELHVYSHLGFASDSADLSICSLPTPEPPSLDHAVDLNATKSLRVVTLMVKLVVFLKGNQNVEKIIIEKYLKKEI